MITVHEFAAVDIAQDAAFAADGFADEKGFGFGMVEASGMELDELHVGDGGTGAIGHGDSVAGRDVGVGGIEVDFAAASGGEEDDGGEEGGDGIGIAVEGVGTEATILAWAAEFVTGDEVDREMIFED